MADTFTRLNEDTWTAKHTKILMATYKGMSDEDLSETIGLKISTIRNYRNQPYFRERLQALANQSLKEVIAHEVDQTINCRARKKLEAAQNEAVNKIIRLMRKGELKDRLQYEAAKDILDRTGLKAVEVIETRERPYTPEEVERAKSTLSEVETIITRLENKDSKFLLARQRRVDSPIVDVPSSSVTDKGSDAPTQEESSDPD